MQLIEEAQNMELNRRKLCLSFGATAALATLPMTSLFAAFADEKETSEEVKALVAKGLEYLRVQAQAADGSFSSATGVGPTGLVLAAILSSGVSTEDPMAAKALKYLLSHVHDDGGIYAEGSRHQNYDTCIAIVALNKANKDGKYAAQLKAAEAFVKKLQWDGGEGKDGADGFFGGAGYGSKARPDLSNTSFLVDALHDLGRGSDDEAIQRALVFISRCQNLESPANTTPPAAKVNDGGFYYTIANGGESMAGTDANGGLRSYGSMTYAGLKSMIFAGVTKDDQRVKAAVSFLKKNYSIDSNPGMGQSGLFYYYHTMAKALTALGVDEFNDDAGGTHDWKSGDPRQVESCSAAKRQLGQLRRSAG
ncbi:MAG: prenyltransferase/squalene oxidase repeat-containing protein [Pirellulales bacterium]